MKIRISSVYGKTRSIGISFDFGSISYFGVIYCWSYNIIFERK